MYDFKMHLRNNFWVYFFILFIMIAGIVLGIVFAFSGSEYVDLLTSSDQNLFDYINGTAEISSIFFSRLLNMLLFMLIVFISNKTVYTSFISLLLLGYQCMLLVLSCGALISLYGASGVINCILLVLPINLLNLIVMAFFSGASISRAFAARKFRMGYLDSCKYVNFKYTVTLSLILIVLLCVVHSLIVPLMIKSFIIVSF